MSRQRSDLEIRGWLRDRAEAGSQPGPIVAAVMAELDRVPQRRPRPWARRWGRDLPMSIPAPGYRRVGALGLIVVAGLVLLVLVALLAASRRQAPSPLGGVWSVPEQVVLSRDGSHLAFVVYDQVPLAALASPVSSAPLTGDPHLVDIVRLYTVAADGSGLSQIATGGPLGSNWVPAFSADGRHLFFEAAAPHRVGTMSEDGWHLSVVSVTGSEPPVDIGAAGEEVWSPVDDVFAVVTANGELQIVKPDGTVIRTVAVDGQAQYPSWSRDGRHLLFGVGDEAGMNPVTWIADGDGSNAHAVPGCVDAWVTWSPATPDLLCQADDDIQALHADGSPAPEDPSNGLPGFGVLSPDGRTTLMWQDEKRPGISVFGADGFRVRLTDDPMDRYPEWSPDGRWVSFLGNRPEGAGLFIVPAAGGAPTLVGANLAAQPQPESVGTGGPWRASPGRGGSIAFIQDHAVVTVTPDAGFQPIVVAGTGTPSRGEPLPPDVVADHVVLLDDGPDRTLYRVRARRDPTFTVENQTDASWTIDLYDDVGSGERVCEAGGGPGRLIAAVGEFPMPGAPPPDSSPPTCTVPAHGTLRVTDVGFVPRGALEVHFSRVDPGHDVSSIGRVVMFDFLPGG